MKSDDGKFMGLSTKYSATTKKDGNVCNVWNALWYKE